MGGQVDLLKLAEVDKGSNVSSRGHQAVAGHRHGADPPASRQRRKVSLECLRKRLRDEMTYGPSMLDAAKRDLGGYGTLPPNRGRCLAGAEGA